MSLRFDRFELRAFGPFTATALELARRARRRPAHHVRAERDREVHRGARCRHFLFGIPPRSTDNQIHDYGDMRLAAVLVDEDRRRHELVRRKGSRSTLLGPDGEPVDDGVLDSMLGGMTREVFEAMFSITHESLVIGGNALLAADGNVGGVALQRQPRRDRAARASREARSAGRRPVSAARDIKPRASGTRGG